MSAKDEHPDDEDVSTEKTPPDTSENDEEPPINNNPVFADDEDINKEVPIKRENTLKRIREDYDEPWKGSIREAIQNGGDAFGRNKTEGILNEDHHLQIRFQVDTEQETFTYKDNAGGMTRETLEDNLLGIDTPDEDKGAGEGAGAYGRGFYVVSMCGAQKTYVETRHAEEHWSSTVTNVGEYSEPSKPTGPRLEDDIQGTYIHVAGVLDHDMGVLSDWEKVEDVLLRSFTFLLLRDDVTVEYYIDGERHIPDPPQLNEYLQDGQLIYKEKLPEFSAEGDKHQIRDLYVMRTDVMDEDVEVPWKGVAMLKGNKYLDHPFMTVKTYKPQNIPSIKRPPEMIGWCDASDLCPELENNSHTSFRNNETDSGIKEVLLDLHKEYFKKGRSTEEREELANKITESINELLVDYEDFNPYHVPDDGYETEKGTDEDDDTENTRSLIKCQAGKREFDVGGKVQLEIQVENPNDAEYERYEIFDIQVSSNSVGVNRSLPSRIVEVAANDHRTFDVQTFRPTEEGIYSFSAKIRGQPEVMEMEGGDHETLDTSQMYFYAGDVERRTGTPSDDTDETEDGDSDGDDDTTQVSVIKETTLYARGDETWKTMSEPQEDGGIDLVINSNHPEWARAMRITNDDGRRDRIQHRLGTVWGINEAVLYLNIDELHDLLGEHNIDGENTANLLTEKLRNRSRMLAEMEATIVNQYGVEYER
jgi:hypothetical protein